MTQRTQIPSAVAADVLFRSDRTCCVCRERGRPVQIHHLDGDPSNQDADNLAVLCFDCHRDTQVQGGFDRKLDADQIRLYRKDWYQHVAQRRSLPPPQASPPPQVTTSASTRGVLRHSTAMVNYINTLPGQRRVAYAQAQKGWDKGNTPEMMNASYGLIHNLEAYLVGLASFYPHGHFGDLGADEYFHGVTAARFTWHRNQLEPDGPGTGGTIIGPIASAKVITDLEQMIVDMVRSLTRDATDFNFLGWLNEWGAAA